MTQARGRDAVPPASDETVLAEPQPDPERPAAYPPDQDGLVPTHDGGTTSLLAKFLSRSPFLDLHARALDIDGGEHRVRAAACFALDCLFRAVVVVLILGIVAGVAWKTLAPLPHLTVPR